MSESALRWRMGIVLRTPPADAFLEEAHSGLRSIRQYPEASPVVVGAIRRKLLQRFPYAIIYSLRPQGIRVLAVAHLKRRPFYWSGRE